MFFAPYGRQGARDKYAKRQKVVKRERDRKKARGNEIQPYGDKAKEINRQHYS